MEQIVTFTSFYCSESLGTKKLWFYNPPPHLTVSDKQAHTLIHTYTEPRGKQQDAGEHCICNWSRHSSPDRIFSKSFNWISASREGKMLLPFQPNIPGQTLASAVCVCPYIMTMNILKVKWSLLSAKLVTVRWSRCSEWILHFASHDHSVCWSEARPSNYSLLNKQVSYWSVNRSLSFPFCPLKGGYEI